MPVRRTAVFYLMNRIAGSLTFNFLGCKTLSERQFDTVRQTADDIYTDVVMEIDWSRILIEATIRCSAHGHDDAETFGNFPCGMCVRDALLNEDRTITDLEPPDMSRWLSKPDWAAQVAHQIKWRRK